MNFIEVTERGKLYFINVNKILFVDADDRKGGNTRITLESLTVDGTALITLHVEEKYEDVKNLIYRS